MPFTEQMTVRDALLAHPEAIHVFESHGLHCAVCMVSDSETIGEVAASHPEIDTDAILADLNALETDSSTRTGAGGDAHE
ncbi:MAG: hypothetical protein Kow0056_02820 [Coriobacteriia bacterium]